MKSVTILIVGTLLAVVPAIPVGRDISFPIIWETVQVKAHEYNKLLDGTFNIMRILCGNSDSGILLSEEVINAHERAKEVVIEVLSKIEDRTLNCDDIRGYTGDVIEIFLHIMSTLLESAELSPEAHAGLRTVYVATVLDSSKIVNQIASLLGCPNP